VKLTLLPTACLWSPWSDWTACSSSCGAGKKERQRSVVLLEKNGGACPGRSKEFVECEEECEEQDLVTESNNALEDIATESENYDELTTASATEDENEDHTEEVTISSSADGTEADEEKTVTQVVTKDKAEDGSELEHDYEQTTILVSEDNVVDALTETVFFYG